MRKFAFIFLFFSAPAFSAGLEIELVGENVEGVIRIDLLEDFAPRHVAQITTLALNGEYDLSLIHI